MSDVFEIIAAVLAAFGLWTLLHDLCDFLIYPARVRKRVNAAIYIEDDMSDVSEIATYVKSLRREGKISSERLILISKSGIIINNVENQGGNELDG